MPTVRPEAPGVDWAERGIMTAQRIDERHVGVKFGDIGPSVSGEEVPGRHWHVTLDSVAVEQETVEAYAGREGWVRYTDDEVKHGTVRVWTCMENC